MRKIQLLRREVENLKGMVEYEIGSLKETKNFNRVLDTAEFLTKTYKNTDADYKNIDSLLKEGTFVKLKSSGAEYSYVIDDVKKTRTRKDGTVKHYKYFVTLVGTEILAQKTAMPNKSLTQLVVGEQKTIEQVLNDYFEFFFKPLWKLNYQIIMPKEIIGDFADEFVWKTPTLYDVINDIMPEKYKLKLEFGDYTAGERVVISFVDITQDPVLELDENIVSKVEYNKSLEQNPKHVSSVIENVILRDSIKERLIPQTTDVGVMDDMDESTRYETTFGIGNIKKAYIEGELEWTSVEIDAGVDLTYHYGHLAGYTKIDITDYIITKEVYDSLLALTTMVNFAGFEMMGDLALDYKNFYLYYEKGKSYIGGVLANVTQKILITFTDFNLGYVLNHIAQNRPELILEYQHIPAYEEPHKTNVPVPYFFNEDIKHLKLTIEYDVLDDVRFDIIKEEHGFGQFVQNQSSVYVNFDKFKEHLEKVMAQLDGEEQVVFGRYHKDHERKPMLNQLYNDKIVAQLVTIETLNYIDFMAVLTSKNNRIDSDAIINTQKRYYNIIDATDSIRRFDFIEAHTDLYGFEEFQNINKANVYGLLRTVDRSNSHLASSWMKLSVYKTEDVIYFFGKALDNKYIGKRIVQESNYKATEGVFYTDDDTGEFYDSSLLIVETDELPNNDYPLYTIEPETTMSHMIYDFIKLKDSGEKIAFTIAMRVPEAFGDSYTLGIYANYELEDDEGIMDDVVAEFEVKTTIEGAVVFIKDIDLQALYEHELLDDEGEADDFIKEIVASTVADSRIIKFADLDVEINIIQTLIDNEAVGDIIEKDILLETITDSRQVELADFDMSIELTKFLIDEEATNDAFVKEILMFIDLDDSVGHTADLNLGIFYDYDLTDEASFSDVIEKEQILNAEATHGVGYFGDINGLIIGDYDLQDEQGTYDVIEKNYNVGVDALSETIRISDLEGFIRPEQELIDEMATMDLLIKNHTLHVDFLGSKYGTVKADHKVYVTANKQLTDYMATADSITKAIEVGGSLVVQAIGSGMSAPTIVNVNANICEKITVTIRNNNSYGVNLYDNGSFVGYLNANSNRVFTYGHDLNGSASATGGNYQRTYKFVYGNDEKETELNHWIPPFCIPEFMY